MLNTNWVPVYNSNNVNDAYNYFEKKIKESYYKSFKLVKLSRKRMKDKKWITSGLKNSSRHKNRLYRKWMQTRKNKDGEKYKTYRKYYKQVMNEAQKSYFSDLFDTKANTVKQLWNNLASVASLSKSKNKSNINELLINNNRITDPKMI